MPGAVKLDMKIAGAANVQKAARLLGVDEMPYMKDALVWSGHALSDATRSRAPGGIGSSVEFKGITGKAHAQRATVSVKDPAGKPNEFGRTTYYEGFKGRKQKATGHKIRSSGQKARPFAGVKDGGHAIGAVRGPVEEHLIAAVAQEWERLGVLNGPAS